MLYDIYSSNTHVNFPEYTMTRVMVETVLSRKRMMKVSWDADNRPVISRECLNYPLKKLVALLD